MVSQLPTIGNLHRTTLGEPKIGDETIPETAFRVTLLGLRLMSNCYQSSHFHALNAML